MLRPLEDEDLLMWAGYHRPQVFGLSPTSLDFLVNVVPFHKNHKNRMMVPAVLVNVH